MEQIIAQLVELQQIDDELAEIEELKGDLPMQVNQLSEDLAALETQIATGRGRLEEIATARRVHEGEVSDQKTHLEKFKEQQLLVSTNRAYDALMHEMDGAKEKISVAEDAILALDEEEENLEKELESARAEQEQKQQSFADQKGALEQTIAETDAQQKALLARRKKAVEVIPADVVAHYTRLYGAREGVAVAEVSRGACGSCYNQVPTQMLQEVPRRERLITCDSCGVILVNEA